MQLAALPAQVAALVNARAASGRIARDVHVQSVASARPSAVLAHYASARSPSKMRLRIRASAALPLLLLVRAAAAPLAAAPLPPLPALQVAGPLTVSGVSAGADFAAQFLVAFADSVSAAAVFAGQAPFCATTRFANEAVVAGGCLSQPRGDLGPGCSGLPTTGAAPCVGCSPDGTTLQLDHCKRAPSQTAQPELLVALLAQAAALGQIAPFDHLNDGFHKLFAFRGMLDGVYLPGSVNTTVDTFVALGVNARDTHFEASVNATHSMPSTDPALPRSSCASFAPGYPGLENCGFDGAGAMFDFFFADLVQPANGTAAVPENLVPFNQTLYEVGAFAGFATTGYIYVPNRCSAAGGRRPCALHVAFHGCGQHATYPGEGMAYTLHSGYAQWADANDFAILMPQMGGFAERNITGGDAPRQLEAGCFDAFGQSGPAYAWRSGPQMAAVAKMIQAVGGGRWWREEAGRPALPSAPHKWRSR